MTDQSVTEILSMSGYGVYIWTAFGVTLGLLLILYRVNKIKLKQALRQQQQLQQEQK